MLCKIKIFEPAFALEHGMITLIKNMNGCEVTINGYK